MLVLMVLQTVIVKLFINFFFQSLLKTEECNWQDAWGSARTTSVSQQSLQQNCPQMPEKEQWPPHNSPCLNGMEISCLWATRETILKPSSEAQNSLWIKSRTWRRHGTIFRRCKNKLFRVFKLFDKYMNSDGRHCKHLSVLEKVFALTAFALSWIVDTIVDNVSTAKLPWLHN